MSETFTDGAIVSNGPFDKIEAYITALTAFRPGARSPELRRCSEEALTSNPAVLERLARSVSFTLAPSVEFYDCQFGAERCLMALKRILAAISSNDAIQKLVLANCGLGDAAGNAVAELVAKAPRIQALNVRHNAFSSDALEALATEAAAAPQLVRFSLLGDMAPPDATTEPLVAGYVRWWRKHPTHEVKGSEDFRLAMIAATRTSIGEDFQVSILKAQERGTSPGASEQTLQELRQLIAAERERLRAAVPLLMLKACVMGGFQLLRTIPSFNENPGQALPEFIRTQSASQQLDFLLFLAGRYAPRFRAVCDEVVGAVNGSSCVDTLLSKYGLENNEEEYPCVHVQGLGTRIDGIYRSFGSLGGQPLYRREGAEQVLQVAADTGFWVIKPSLCSSATNAELPFSGPPDQNAWHCPQKAPAPKKGQNIQMILNRISLRDELLATAFSSRAPPRRLSGLLAADRARTRCRFGRTKKPAVYLERLKHQQLHNKTSGSGADNDGMKWVSDLNTATLEAEHPAVLSLMYRIIVSIIKRSGGSVVEVINGFASSESNGHPPRISVKFALSGFVMEIHLALRDLAAVRAGLARLRDLERAPNAAEVIHRAFKGSSDLDDVAAGENDSDADSVAEASAKDGFGSIMSDWMVKMPNVNLVPLDASPPTPSSSSRAHASKGSPPPAGEAAVGKVERQAGAQQQKQQHHQQQQQPLQRGQRASVSPRSSVGGAGGAGEETGRSSRREVALLKSARHRLVRLLFRELDVDRTGLLTETALFRFAQLSGFSGDDAEWKALHASIVGCHGWQGHLGLDVEQFVAVVDDHNGPCHCTTGELCSFLAKLEVSETTSLTPTPTPKKSPQDSVDDGVTASTPHHDRGGRCLAASPDGTPCVACRVSPCGEGGLTSCIGSGAGKVSGELGAAAIRRVVAALREVARTATTPGELEAAIKVAQAAGAPDGDLGEASDRASALAERRLAAERLAAATAALATAPGAVGATVGGGEGHGFARLDSGPEVRELESAIVAAEKAEVPAQEVARARLAFVERRRRIEAEERLASACAERDAVVLTAALAEARAAGIPHRALAEYDALLIRLATESHAATVAASKKDSPSAEDTDVTSVTGDANGDLLHSDVIVPFVPSQRSSPAPHAAVSEEDKALRDARDGARAALRAALRGGRAAAIREAIALGRQATLEDSELREPQAALLHAEERERLLGELTMLVRVYDGISFEDIDMLKDARAKISDATAQAAEAGVASPDLLEAELLRKRLHNKIEDMKGTIRVFCRVRPQSQAERDAGEEEAVSQLNPMALQVGKQAFQYDAVFFPGTQDEIFEDCKELVQSAFDGYNVTIFAYGQTGAGKTHTMSGSPGEEGIAPRTIREVFRLAHRGEPRQRCSISCSMLELYKNELVDLLSKAGGSGAPANRRLSVRRGPSMNFGKRSSSVGAGAGAAALAAGASPAAAAAAAAAATASGSAAIANGRSSEVLVDHLSEQVCDTEEALLELLEKGSDSRAVGVTAMNSKSSRSHLMVVLKLRLLDTHTGLESGGKIIITDLAGSERLKKSDPDAETQKESIEINKSLTALGDVIEALTKKQKMIPYRNHKLTQLMQDALGGTSKTLMFVNCAPTGSNVEETLTSLKYAARVKGVINQANNAGSPVAAQANSKRFIPS